METEDPARPAKQNTLAQAAQGRQTAPVAKKDAGGAESSTAESKEPLEEKTGGPPYSETMPPPSETKLAESAGAENTMDEKPRMDAEREAVPASSKENVEEGMTFRDSPLPSLPDSANRVGDGPPQFSNVQVLVQAPTPVVSQRENEIASDRTPQQTKRDSDVEMADAVVPIAPVDEGAVAPESYRDEANVDLPPPPPPAVPEVLPTVAATSGTSPLASTNEKQQWLLPPIQPRFQGKKCLVLDLDETLVHSSFKVLLWQNRCILRFEGLTSLRFSIKQTLPYLWRLRASITTST